ncbi:MAG TPA: DUF4905 domain-containing protein [Bacteroidota bacterium]|nr:DUF4905 domain-containing protein [Bacteroidota bacterium]
MIILFQNFNDPIMGWFSGRKRKTLKPSWSYRTSGFLWRILPSARFLAGEDRDTEKKRVTFFCIDPQSGNVLWEHRMFDEQWWIGLDSLYGETLFFHRYASPDMPEHQGIIAADIRTGTVHWENTEMEFLLAHRDVVAVSKQGFEKRFFHLLDGTTGKVLREIDADEVQRLRAEMGAEHVEEIGYPVPASPSVQSAIQNVLLRCGMNIQEIVNAEAHVSGEYLLSSFYEPVGTDVTSRKFRHHFVIILPESSVLLYHDILRDLSPSTAGDSFFCMGSWVYFISEKQRLSAVNLSNIIGG